MGVRCCARASSSRSKQGCSVVAVVRLLLVVASLVSEHGLQGTQTSVAAVLGLRLPHGMWDLPGPGIEPVFPALQGGFSTTRPPGKSPIDISWMDAWMNEKERNDCLLQGHTADSWQNWNKSLGSGQADPGTAPPPPNTHTLSPWGLFALLWPYFCTCKLLAVSEYLMVK